MRGAPSYLSLLTFLLVSPDRRDSTLEALTSYRFRDRPFSHSDNVPDLLNWFRARSLHRMGSRWKARPVATTRAIDHARTRAAAAARTRRGQVPDQKHEAARAGPHRKAQPLERSAWRRIRRRLVAVLPRSVLRHRPAAAAIPAAWYANRRRT